MDAFGCGGGKGVSYNGSANKKNPWSAFLHGSYLGCYPTEDLAAEAVARALKDEVETDGIGKATTTGKRGSGDTGDIRGGQMRSIFGLEGTDYRLVYL